MNKLYLNYLRCRVRCKNHKAVDQEAALFRQSKVLYPSNSTKGNENYN